MSSPDALDAALAATANALAASRRVAVLTGAGVSAESGIPTFRDALTGHWARFRAEEMGTEDGFRAAPSRVQAWYRARLGAAQRAAPNDGHHALAALATRVPALTLLTQNVDGLHERAGSAGVLALHGRLSDARCIDCGTPGVLPPLGEGDDADATSAPPVACVACGGAMRPGVVWFGEALDEAVLDAASEAVATCDVFLSVGTSGLVHPAAGFVAVARRAGAFVAEVNPAPALTGIADAILAGPSGVVLPRLVAALDARIADRPDAPEARR